MGRKWPRWLHLLPSDAHYWHWRCDHDVLYHHVVVDYHDLNDHNDGPPFDDYDDLNDHNDGPPFDDYDDLNDHNDGPPFDDYYYDHPAAHRPALYPRDHNVHGPSNDHDCADYHDCCHDDYGAEDHDDGAQDDHHNSARSYDDDYAKHHDDGAQDDHDRPHQGP